MEQVLGFKTASVVGVPCLSAASVWKIAIFAASRWQKTTARRDLEPAVQQLAGEGSDAVQLLARHNPVRMDTPEFTCRPRTGLTSRRTAVS